MIIRGNTVGTTVPRPDYGQTDETKSSFILNKPDSAIAKAQQTADTAKKTAEAALSRAGGTMTGPIAMDGNKVTGLAEPDQSSDAATKGYVDGRHILFNLTLTAAGWTGEGPYTQTVAVEGILATDMPHYSLVYDANQDTRLSQKEAFACVDDLDTGDGSVTFTCFEERPEADLHIQMEVNR